MGWASYVYFRNTHFFSAHCLAHNLNDDREAGASLASLLQPSRTLCPKWCKNNRFAPKWHYNCLAARRTLTISCSNKKLSHISKSVRGSSAALSID
jgi:hypothetical protein